MSPRTRICTETAAGGVLPAAAAAAAVVVVEGFSYREGSKRRIAAVAMNSPPKVDHSIMVSGDGMVRCASLHSLLGCLSGNRSV